MDHVPPPDLGVGLAAVLWDMDGLLVDSEPLWTVAETELAEAHGRTWTDQVKAQVMGHGLVTAVPIMLQALDLPPELADETGTFLLQRMAALLGAGGPLMPGARELLDATAGLPRALVSSSYRVLVDAVAARLPGDFATTLAGDEVRHTKPHPEPYLRAAQRLGVAPAACLVLEDSTAGVSAGLAAGCRVVQVAAAGQPHQALPAGAHRVASLHDLVPLLQS